jgi:transposase
MDVVYERCCGLDVHKQTVVACLVTPGERGRPRKEVRTFGTMTEDLVALGDWLAEHRVSHVALESSGVYWQPVWNVLEEGGRFALLLVNAHHVKAVPGRKTDVKDCEWLADLLRHGLLRASFVPPREQREQRELTRYRTSLVEERTAHVNRLQRTLEGANIKLAAVASDVLGASARQMLEQLVTGVTDPAALAELARGRLREKVPALERALAGRFGPHHRFLVAEHLAAIDFLDGRIAAVSARIEATQRPFGEAVGRLDEVSGIGRRLAEISVAELGPDVRRFPSAAALSSWAGVCRGNRESAGKRRSGRTRKGNRALRAALIEAGQAAGRARASYLGAFYRRLAARRGKKRAAVATGRKILEIVYHLLRDGTRYRDLGPNYLDHRASDAAERRLIRRLERRGYIITRDPEAA